MNHMMAYAKQFLVSARIWVALAAALLLAGAPMAQARHVSRAGAAPRAGGTLLVNRSTAGNACLDPTQASNGAYDISTVLFDPLVTFDNHGHVRPDLATSWKVSHNNTVITFNLRHGVRFSNGDPFDASAMKYSLARVVDPAVKSPESSTLTQVKTVRVLDKYTLQLVLAGPFRPIMTSLALPYLGALDPRVTRSEGSRVCTEPIGTGSYMVKSVAPDASTITLVRNPYHTWEPPFLHQGPGYLSTLVFKSIASDTTAVSELLTGDLNYTPLPAEQLNRVQGNSSFKVYKDLQEGEGFLNFNESHPPFNQVEIRRAVAEAIDRKALITAALNGLGKPALSPLAERVPYYSKAAARLAPQYNPSDARAIFARNHITGPFTLLAWDFNGLKTAAEIVQSELQQVGVSVNIVTKNLAEYVAQAAKGNFDINLFNYGYTDPDIFYIYWHSSQESGGGYNYTFLKSPQLDSLIVKGRESLDPKVAAKAYTAAQEYMNRNVIIDPLYSAESLYALSTKFGGWHIAAGGYVPYFQELYLRK
jgi:peptide/nickel transport system substrate-binding protein